RGAAMDGEDDGQPSVNADGDDNNPAAGPDDEDGSTSPLDNAQVIVGATLTIPFSVAVPAGIAHAYLDGWADWNRDGDWADPGEQVFNRVEVHNGVNPLSFTIPADASPGLTYSRLRLSSSGGLSYPGLAADGEVEDSAFPVIGPDFGDAPDSSHTLRASDGARHGVVAGFHLGAAIDGEDDGQPSVNADGDDNNPAAGPDDEDGSTSPLDNAQVIVGATLTIPFSVAVPAGIAHAYLDGWADWNRDGDWA